MNKKRILSSVLLTVFMATTIFTMNGQIVYGKDLTSESKQKGQSMKTITEDVYSSFTDPTEIINNGRKTSGGKLEKKIADSKNEILVKYKSKSKAKVDKEKIFKNNKKLSKLKVKNSNKKFQIDTIEIGEADDMKTVLEELQKNADVLYAQPNYELNLFNTPSDSQFNEQWNLLK